MLIEIIIIIIKRLLILLLEIIILKMHCEIAKYQKYGQIQYQNIFQGQENTFSTLR